MATAGASSSRQTQVPARTAKSPESHDSIRRRNGAAEILQSYEKLSWLSFQRCESIMQTRMHYMRIVAGYADNGGGDDEVIWKEDFTPHPRPNGEESKASRKGKERVSTGSARGSDADGSEAKGSKAKERKSVGGSGSR